MRLNYWFLTATLELFLAFVLIVSGATRAGAIASLMGSIFVIIGMVREHQKGL